MDGFNYRIGSIDNRIGRPPRFYRSDVLVREGCRFASVYAVRVEDAHAIHQAGTAAHFRGVVWSQRLWIDFDNYEAARQAEATIKAQGLDYVVYDTGGGRGVHIGISRAASPSHLLPVQDRQWVEQHCPGADIGLYWHLHLLRLPGALHENTGLPKRLLRAEEGQELNLPPYVPGAAQTQEVGVTDVNRDSIFKVWSVASRLVGAPGESRHNHLVQLAAALRNEGKVTREEALWMVLEVNRGFDDPKDAAEVEKIVEWAYT